MKFVGILTRRTYGTSDQWMDPILPTSFFVYSAEKLRFFAAWRRYPYRVHRINYLEKSKTFPQKTKISYKKNRRFLSLQSVRCAEFNGELESKECSVKACLQISQETAIHTPLKHQMDQL